MDYYNQISEGYEELHKKEQIKKIEIIKQHLKINNDDLLLDIGCGPYFGDFDCRVIGIDSSIELLKRAKIPKVLGVAEKLPFKDKTFDIVVSITALQNFNEVDKALKEIKRVGKKSFGLTFLKKSEKAGIIEELILKHFSVSKRIVEDKDFIYITKYKN